ncbi:MAG: sodium:proton antiporter, partial [Alphaproteobacteria bacterium]|nr:sodium:proton antiporter [Alphaproteobacteria bacterium]
PMVLTAGLLLLAFYVVDRRLARGETPPREDGTLRIHGGINILWLLGVVLAVLMSGLWRPEFGFEVFGIRLGGQALLRDGLLILFAALSFATTPSGLRAANGFSWTPIEEVALLFFGIFITVVPALDILGAGRDGALGPLIAALAGPDGEPAPARYFWATGILSAFLDNAPTYLVFFKMAGGEAEALMRPPATVLTAISCGAVFMGALSYIGNAPNLMVKAICEAEGVRMPGFFAYLLWAALLLLPTQLLLSLVFFL